MKSQTLEASHTPDRRIMEVRIREQRTGLPGEVRDEVKAFKTRSCAKRTAKWIWAKVEELMRFIGVGASGRRKDVLE